MYKEIPYPWGLDGIYPERDDRHFGKSVVEGLHARRRRAGMRSGDWIVAAVTAAQAALRDADDDRILETARLLRPLLKKHGFTRELVGQAFALVREAARRHTGMAHFDVQLIGGCALLKGMVAEMETGEGKTLTATLPASTLALAGVPVHIISVNDYLTARDADWMAPVYTALGLTVGTIVHGKEPAARKAAYGCDIAYCTNKEVAFDYLRDRLVLPDRPGRLRLSVERLYGTHSRVGRLVMRGLHFAIVDEADSVLIDEARTPLVISSHAEGSYGEEVYRFAMELTGTLSEGRDFTVAPSDRFIDLTPAGRYKVESADWNPAGTNINDQQKEQLVRQSLTAHYLYKKDKQYLVKDGKVQIVDEYTGRLMADRSWEMGLHQLIEIKEGCQVTLPRQTLARISYQRFFRRYLGLAGMSGTAREVAGELWAVYRLPVVAIQTHKPVRRRLLPDRMHATAAEKWSSVVNVIMRLHAEGRPVLVGTRSVEASEHLGRLLEGQSVPHKVLNARQDQEEAEIVAQAGERGRITVATNMAGRGTDIRLGEGVADLGGLFVIATERHESRRIDRQLFGRCGRQGDPGTCVAMIALDDELATLHAGALWRWFALLALKTRMDRVSRWAGAVLFWQAQRSAGRLHARVRRNLLKMDDRIGESLAFSGRPE